MKIGIISDTHNHYQSVLKAVGIFNERNVDYVFHAGDIVSPLTAEAFAGIDGAKFIAVFGNCDSKRSLLQRAIGDFGGEIHDGCYKGRVGGKRIFMTHKPGMLSEVVGSGEFDLVIYGHTHKQDVHKVKETLVINPGTLKHWLAAKSQVVVLELDDMSVEVVSLK